MSEKERTTRAIIYTYKYKIRIQPASHEYKYINEIRKAVFSLR